MLNPKLHQKLLQLFSSVRVSDENAIRAELVDGTAPPVVIQVLVEGERYQSACPFCRKSECRLIVLYCYDGSVGSRDWYCIGCHGERHRRDQYALAALIDTGVTFDTY